MSARPDEIAVTLGDLPPLAQLQKTWRAREARAESSFFQSWQWIGVWLESLPRHITPWLLHVQRGGVTVGLGILTRREIVRYGLLRSHALFLNDTGDPALDEITIEHNGFLAERGNDAVVTRACVEFLLREYSDWDELFLDGLRQPDLVEVLALDRARLRSVSRCQCYFVDLDALRRTGGDYLSLLGKNTRYSIRRSVRAYEKRGALHLEQAASVSQAHEFLDRLRHFHQRYWLQKGMPGSFANSFFTDFHTRLIKQGVDAAAIQMLRLTAGDHEVGYLYNFVYRGRVYNYQSGFDYDLVGTHGRPGLVCHALAVEHNVKQGHAVYDFMAGDSDYKKNLGTASETMTWSVIQQARLKFRIEDALRTVKQRLWRRASLAERVPLSDSNQAAREEAL